MLESLAAQLHAVVGCSKVSAVSLAETLRALRNCCAGKQEVQIVACTAVLNDVIQVLNTISVKQPIEEWTICLRLGVQLIGNLAVNNRANQCFIWTHCQYLLRNLLSFEDVKLKDFVVMVLYNIVLGFDNILPEVILDHGSMDIILHEASCGSEFPLYLLEYVVCNSSHNWEPMYKRADLKARLLLLRLVDDCMRRPAANRQVPAECILMLARVFRQCSDYILKAVTKHVEGLEPLEVVQLLELLASASSDSPYLDQLQQDTSLFINTTCLLRSIHAAGKVSENSFTPIQKLSFLTSNDENIEDHPAYGFKASLIRVIGNLCWKHKKNQDLARELECLPLLLDCCNIDARNPLIIQWVVLAVRNLCDNSPENQAVIAALTQQGAVSSRLLSEFGLTIHADNSNNLIRVVPLK